MISDFSKLFIGMGVLLVAVGIFLSLGEKFPWIGRLPGDFLVRKGNFSFYFPLATSLGVSLVLSLLLLLLNKK